MTGVTKNFGVHSEVGKLRTVMVRKPGLAHQGLTPANCRDLLFDGALWVDHAQKDYAEFVGNMRARGVEVLELRDLLAETMRSPEARSWVFDRRMTPNGVQSSAVTRLKS